MTRRFTSHPSLMWMLAIALVGVGAIAWAQTNVRQEVTGTAGGTVRATQWGVTATGPCMGWVPATAQHGFELRTPADIRIAVRSHTDTTLVLRGETPAGAVTLCNDDHEGSNPGLTQTLQPGSYEVFVGTWDAGDRVPFTMSIERQDRLAP